MCDQEENSRMGLAPAARSPDWDHLPLELLQIISDKISSAADYVRFRAACSRWRSASPPVPRRLPPQFPWLMLPPDPHDPSAGSARFFYDLLEAKTRRLDIPEAGGRRCACSSHGWLVLQKGSDVSLLNPLTQAHIPLPSLAATNRRLRFSAPGDGGRGDGRLLDLGVSYLTKELIKKATLTSNPSLDPTNCIVLALFQIRWLIAFCQIGDESWTVIEQNNPHPDNRLVDATYQNGRFYTVDYQGQVTVYDLGCRCTQRLDSAQMLGDAEKYLVERESGGLLMVVNWNYREYIPEHWNKYAVYRLKEEEDGGGQPLWVEAKNFRECALFLGGNGHCSSLCPAAWDECGGGWLYFAFEHSQREGGVGCGVKLFLIDGGRTMPVASHLGGYCSKTFSQALWFSPSLC